MLCTVLCVGVVLLVVLLHINETEDLNGVCTEELRDAHHFALLDICDSSSLPCERSNFKETNQSTAPGERLQ
jgi:hypothetical protein